MRAAIRLFGAAMIAGLMMSSALFAGTMETDLVGQLRAQGYSGIRVTHTWLGRVRIDARLDMFRREIILNPNTGEILRDYQGAIAQAVDNDDHKPSGSVGMTSITRSGDGDVPTQELTTPSVAGDQPE